MTNSATIRSLVASGRLSADDAVDHLLAAGEHGGHRDCEVTCPECGQPFWRSHPGRWNTCGDQCQISWNTAIMDIDDGRSIVKLSSLTDEQAAALLADAGLVVDGTGEVVRS